MWGIIPAAGIGSRIQPLAFSKELLPVGSSLVDGTERPRAVSDYLIERLERAGVTKLCFVISPRKRDILEHYGGSTHGASVCYVVQESARGLCDAVFRAAPVVPRDENVAIGLPDTIWFPADALAKLPNDALALLLFPVERPESFDAVLTEDDGSVREIRVKLPNVGCHQVWGAMRMPGAVFHALHDLWLERGRQDEYLGTLINAYLAAGGRAVGVPSGSAYFDVGTVAGWREAVRVLAGGARIEASAQVAAAPTGLRANGIAG